MRATLDDVVHAQRTACWRCCPKRYQQVGLLFFQRGKSSLSKQKLGFRWLKSYRSRAQKTTSSSLYLLVVYTADSRKSSTCEQEFTSLPSREEDNVLKRRCQIISKVRIFLCAKEVRARTYLKLGKDLQFRKTSLFITILITSNGRLDQRAWFKNDILEHFFENSAHTLRWVTTDTPRRRERKTPPEPLHLWEGEGVWYIEFGALQLACTSDLSKRPQNKNKSWQEVFVLFAFTNKKSKKTFLAI